jgi:hypothetical protein
MSRTKYIKKSLENNGLVSSRKAVKGEGRRARWHKVGVDPDSVEWVRNGGVIVMF